MSIERIELRKKYYDGNMVREAVMSVTDDYNTIMKLLLAFADQPLLTDVIEVVRCGECKHWDKESTFCLNIEGCYGNETTPNWFCADGEKGEEKE